MPGFSLSSFTRGGKYYGLFSTHDQADGSLKDPVEQPNAIATVNGEDRPSWPLAVAKLSKGRYAVSGTVPQSLAAGDIVHISAYITMVNGKQSATAISEFRIVDPDTDRPPPTEPPTGPPVVPGSAKTYILSVAEVKNE